MAFLAAHRIGTADSPHGAGARPGLYAITLKGAERSFTYWRGDSVARHLADDAAALARSLAGRDLVYFSGITLAILAPEARRILLDAVAISRGNGAAIAFDPNYRARLWASRAEAAASIEAAAKGADIVLPTFDDEQALFGDSDPAATLARLQRLGVSECVVKNGVRPALVAHGTERHEVPAVAGVAAVDTSGAGNAFNGAYLAARLARKGPLEAARFAHRIAALAVGVRGALTPVDLLRAQLGPA